MADPYPVILVADRAILSDQSLKYVLVVNKAKNNVVERVDIKVSNRLQENGRRAVEAGLKGDEWIIVDGVNRARPGATVSPKEAVMPSRPVSGKQLTGGRPDGPFAQSTSSEVGGSLTTEDKD